MTQDSAGSLLSKPPPRLSAEALSGLARRHWGIDGTLHPLTSERDQNCRLETGQGSFTLKLTNPAEPAPLTEFQTLALIHVAREVPDLPLPRVVPAKDGRAIVPTPHGALRLLGWLHGTTLANVPRTPSLAAAIGDALGKLDAALRPFGHPAANHHLLWDIQNTADLVPLFPALPDALRRPAEAVAARFSSHVAPALSRLPRQVIHGDFNPHNLLVDAADPRHLTGILDFGDMALSYRICDLAVAGSYLIDEDDPLRLLGPLVAAYDRADPLTSDELSVLPDLIRARLVATLTISAWRASRYPENAAYILRNAPVSRSGLAALSDLGSAGIADTLATFLERPGP